MSMQVAEAKQTKNTVSKKETGKPGLFFQPKLTINAPSDVYEQEADAMADKVMRMPSDKQSFFKPSPLSISRLQRKCQHCEEEEKMQRKETNNEATVADTQTENYISSLNGKGKSLSNEERSFFEPRFGYDFSDVQLHTNSEANQSAKNVNALAYTHGNNIVFGANQHQPNTNAGNKLIAHELTHVVQQSSKTINRKVQRAVGIRSRCTANADNAPSNPMDLIQAANNKAVLMSLGTSLLLVSESLFMQDATFGPSTISASYHNRFGDPSVSGTKFKNRFSGRLYDTLIKAQASEMQFLSNRLKTISEFLAGPIHFKCTGTTHTTIGSCTHHCNPNDDLASCNSGHGREIAICPDFWNLAAPDQQAIGMIHETLHMLFHFGDHDSAPFANTSAKRLTEPECAASFVADIYGITPFDPSCPNV